MAIRSPIIVTVGHIDHGKTTLLDKIRGTAVAKTEAGGISQDVGASYIPIKTIENICGQLLEKFKIKLTIPGLLLVDTPGHAAFITLRKRGGSVADLAILVIDVNEGFQEQTDESLTILKEYNTPFVVAATKIDKIQGWFPRSGSFSDSIAKQQDYVKDELERKVYSLVSQLAEREFDSERFDKITDFRKQVAIVPCSGVTGEGVPELLMVLAGLAQQFLKDRLVLSDIARGTILEVKEVRGLGTTIDVILYDGSIKRGDYLVIGGKEPLVTRVKALLKPRSLQELRVEKQFENIEKTAAAAGIKIIASIENVIAGSPIIAVDSEEKTENAKIEIQKEVEEVEFTKQIDGVVVKADTLGGLEALIKILTEGNIPIRKAEVGQITREDLTDAQTTTNELNKVILVFDLKASEESKELARNSGVTIFENNVIYRLIEDYKQWCLEKKERDLQEKLEKVSRPVEIQLIKGAVFRSSNPAIFGIEILRGYLKPGILLKRKDGKIIGKIKEIQSEGKTISSAKKGDKVAVSIENVVVGRHIFEGDKLVSVLNNSDLQILKEVYEKLTDSEKELLNELA